MRVFASAFRSAGNGDASAADATTTSSTTTLLTTPKYRFGFSVPTTAARLDATAGARIGIGTVGDGIHQGTQMWSVAHPLPAGCQSGALSSHQLGHVMVPLLMRKLSYATLTSSANGERLVNTLRFAAWLVGAAYGRL